MKSLKQFTADLGGYKPGNEAEQNFVAKHIIKKVQDRNGNKDDIFQATNVKTIDRSAEKHGYDKPEDEKVNEEFELDEGIESKGKNSLPVNPHKAPVPGTYAARPKLPPVKSEKTPAKPWNEETELAEGFVDKVKTAVQRYKDKSSKADAAWERTKNDAADYITTGDTKSATRARRTHKVLLKHGVGTNPFLDFTDLGVHKEETELAEVSKSLLQNYVGKALKDVRSRVEHGESTKPKTTARAKQVAWAHQRIKKMDEGFDPDEFARHMAKLKAQKELEKTNPMKALVSRLKADHDQKHSINKPQDGNGRSADPYDPYNPYGVGPNSIHHNKTNEELELDEKTLTPAELKKREEIAQAMERENPGMDKSKKMAIATAQAKRVAESLEETKDAKADKTNVKAAVTAPDGVYDSIPLGITVTESADAKARYNEYHDAAQELAKKIRDALAASKKNVPSDKVHWGHVGDIRHYHNQLQDLHDQLAQRGEYQRDLFKEDVDTGLLEAFADSLADDQLFAESVAALMESEQ